MRLPWRRNEYRVAPSPVAQRLRSELMTEWWQERFLVGACGLDEAEAGIERALRGECSDEEFVGACRVVTFPVASFVEPLGLHGVEDQ